MNGVDKELWARLSPRLDELLDLDTAARAARLAALRASEPALAEALDAMLAKLPVIEKEGFLDTPAMPRPAELAGQAVGAYTLERELGHGGMGTVWLARRADGRYEGQVAIKFLRAGVFGHGDLGRFQREGSILARLSHPHIARLLDAGIRSDGTQPYLVLEYIDGEPIDRYCDARALGTAQRLRLFLDVLSAVAHAHNRLILHRDLKPSNILVTAAGEVKLLDFGIAKLLDEAGAGAATELTARAGNAFTPQFAAPEQLQGGDVTTATDVYALGVLLYLLLGGPHPTLGPTEAPLDRMRAIIEVDPRKLSDAILRRADNEGTSPAAARRLAGELQGDIDTIVARALKKSPAQRYANAADLADDIRRYLAHEPIAARPDSRLYRVAKFVRRHRTGVAAGAVTAVALGIGVAVALWQAHEARAQREQAESLIEFMLGDLRKKLTPVGRLDVLDAVGERALAYYSAQDPERLDSDSLGRRARALHMIGGLAEHRGRLDEAQREFQQAADSTRRLLARHPDDAQRVFDHSQSEFWLGLVEWRRGHDAEAERAFRDYGALADRMIRLDPGNVDYQLEKYYAEQDLGVVLLDLGRPAETLALASDASEGLRRIARSRPDLTVDAAHCLGWKARAQEDLGRFADAIASNQAKLELARMAPGGDRNQEARFVISNAHVEMGRAWLKLGRLQESEALTRTAIDEEQRLSTHDPANLDWASEMISAQAQLAVLMSQRGDRVDARALVAPAQATLDRLLSTPEVKRNWRIGQAGEVALMRALLADSAAERDEARRVLAGYLADVARFEAAGGLVTSEERTALGRAELVEGRLLAAAGRAQDAQAAWARATQRLQPGVAARDPGALTWQAWVDVERGDIQAAHALADSIRATNYRHPAVIDLFNKLGQAS